MVPRKLSRCPGRRVAEFRARRPAGKDHRPIETVNCRGTACRAPTHCPRTITLAKNKSQEEQIHKGLDKLREAGLALDGSAPELVPKLKEHFGKEKQIDLAVVFALGKIIDSTAVEALAEIEKQSTDKETKKEIKRSFFKLGQRGLTIAREEARENKPATAFFS